MPLESLGFNLERCPAKHFRRYGGRKLIIAGSARCVWDDLRAMGLAHADRASFPWEVMVLNDLIMHIPWPAHHAYSNDHKMLPRWLAARRPDLARDKPLGGVHTCSIGPNDMNVWPWSGQGTSGLNAVLTGLAMGYDRIVLCGIPLDDEGHYFDAPWVRSRFTQEIREGHENPQWPRYWDRFARKCFDNKVRSMSGRTRDMLGGPGD